MFLSVIIPTRNRADDLREVLQSLLNQTLGSDRFEVLVVDNGSTDDTCSVVGGFTCLCDNFHYFFEKIPGLHAGRHRGLMEAAGDVLVFADDDIVASPTWLEAVYEAFRTSGENVALVGGNNYPRFEKKPTWWIECLWRPRGDGRRFIAEFSVLDFGKTPCKMDPFYVWGCNFAVRKSILLNAGGFHPDGMPQDLLLFRGDGESWVSQFILENGYEALFIPAASVEHKVSAQRMTREYFKRRAFAQGVSDSFTVIRASVSQGCPPWSTLWARRMKNLLRPIRDAFRWGLNPLQLWEWLCFSWAVDRARKEGFEWHRENATCDKTLKEWILRPDYMGDNAVVPTLWRFEQTGETLSFSGKRAL